MLKTPSNPIRTILVFFFFFVVSWFQKLKEEADKIQEEYGYCILDGHREKIGNFKTEPPGLFRGRGEHPKMGMLKKRIMPEDVVINCSRWVVLGSAELLGLPLGLGAPELGFFYLLQSLFSIS